MNSYVLSGFITGFLMYFACIFAPNALQLKQITPEYVRIQKTNDNAATNATCLCPHSAPSQWLKQYLFRGPPF